MVPPLALPWSILISRGQPGLNIVSFRGAGKGEVFVVASAIKSFILKLHMVTSIFCRRLWLSRDGRKENNGGLTVVHCIRITLSSFFIAALCILHHFSLAERIEQVFFLDVGRLHIATIRLT